MVQSGAKKATKKTKKSKQEKVGQAVAVHDPAAELGLKLVSMMERISKLENAIDNHAGHIKNLADAGKVLAEGLDSAHAKIKELVAANDILKSRFDIFDKTIDAIIKRLPEVSSTPAGVQGEQGK